MASVKSPGHRHESRRVFVLVDNDKTQGVFTSWEAAEAYADKHGLSLERLMEFATHPDHPDHLHLMAVAWGDTWKFLGQWSKRPLVWTKPPEKVRLEHYHAKGEEFKLLRQKEFFWRPTLLEQVNVMAPDSAMLPRETVKPGPAEKSQWKPKISPFKPASGEAVPSSGKPGVQSRKKSRLRLRSEKHSPEPIPVYDASSANEADEATGKFTAELSKMEMANSGDGEPEAGNEGGGVRKIIPIRLILPVVAIFICWGLGIFHASRPEPKAAKMLPGITTLARAEVLIIEPGQVFFELPVDPVNQNRWVTSLGLNEIDPEAPISVPTMHTLVTWEKPQGFIRPPYAAVEVREWWDLRMRNVAYGFYHRWDDGSILIFDLEADILIGWAEVSRLQELLN